MKKEKRPMSIAALILLVLTTVVGLGVYIMLPGVVKLYIDNSNVELAERTYNFILPLLYVVGVPVLGLLGCAILLMHNVARGRAFVWANVHCLRLISVLSFCIALIFTVPMFVLSSIFPIIIFVIFFIFGVIGIVIADLFKTATLLKEENDMTI